MHNGSRVYTFGTEYYGNSGYEVSRLVMCLKKNPLQVQTLFEFQAIEKEKIQLRSQILLEIGNYIRKQTVISKQMK